MPSKMEKTSVPGVYKRGGRYAVSYRHRGKQKWTSAPTLVEARRLKKELDTDVQRGEHRDSSRLTFGEYARDWIDTYQGRTTRGFRESTRTGYRRTIEEKAIPFFDGRSPRMVEIEPRDVAAFVAWLFSEEKQGKRLSVSTVRNHVAAVRALLATAVEDGTLRHNPAAGVRISRSGPTLEKDAAEQRRALDADELARFLAACPEEWRLFFEVLVATGVRFSEAVELRWGDVDLGNKRLRVRRQSYRGTIDEPKSSNGKRNIPLPTGLCQRLWAMQGGEDALLFTDEFGQPLLHHRVSERVLEPTRKAAGVPWATCHSMRHTCASMLFAAGKNIKQVQEWLGHSDPGFTLRTYVHLIDDGLGTADCFDSVAPTGQGVNRGVNTRSLDEPKSGAVIPA